MAEKSFNDFKNQKSVESEKKEFMEPKLKFIEPKLTRHGDATKITGSFFATFTPR